MATSQYTQQPTTASNSRMDFRYQVKQPPPSVWEREQDFLKALILIVFGYLIYQNEYTLSFHRTEHQAQQLVAEGVQAVRTSLPFSAVSEPEPPVLALDQIVKSPKSACDDYIAQFSPVAVAEMRQNGIPASITLAQGLLESNAGQSSLAQKGHNHFGIKCFSKRCKKGHCMNFTDDSHKDFFVKYSNSWSSYKAHSAFLKQTPRYAKLFKLARTDYKGWARGLSSAGYATDKRYGEKLIALIEQLNLTQFDK
jgi:flagellum-specific peptidoglycan hydrolase FlgJ